MLDYTNRVDAPVAFTASTNTNIYLGPQHPVDKALVSGGTGRKPGSHIIKYVNLPATDWPDCTNHIDIKVTSDAAGDLPLATCDFTLTLVANPGLDLDGDGCKGNCALCRIRFSDYPFVYAVLTSDGH